MQKQTKQTGAMAPKVASKATKPAAKPQAPAAPVATAPTTYTALCAQLVAEGWQVLQLASKAKAHKPGTNGVICLYPVAAGTVCKLYSAHVVGPKGLAGSGPGCPKHKLANVGQVYAVANALATQGYQAAADLLYTSATGFADRLNRLAPADHQAYAAKGWVASLAPATAPAVPPQG